MSSVTLFPQVLPDLNFFNVSSSTEAAFRLRALQRVALAAVGGYLLVRYSDNLECQLASTWAGRSIVRLGLLGLSVCLSAPSTCLALTTAYGPKYAYQAFSAIAKKEIGLAIFLLVGATSSYVVFANYRHPSLMIGPNLLEKLFQKVEDRYAVPLWNRFYKK